MVEAHCFISFISFLTSLQLVSTGQVASYGHREIG